MSRRPRIRKSHKKARIDLLCLFVAILVFEVTAPAQNRQYTVGTTIDVIGGQTNSLGSAALSATPETKPFLFYGTYPSITLNSRGANSLFSTSYAFGFNRGEGATALHTNSHSASVNFTTALSPRWRITLSDNFQITDDVATFNGFRGVTPPAEDFRFIFNPVSTRLTNRSNGVSGAVDYSFTDKSSLLFSGSYNLLDYGNNQEVNGILSNQRRISGAITYNRRTSERDTWSIGYTTSYFDFDTFQNSFSDVGRVGYSTQFGPDLAFQVTVGASRTQNQGSSENIVGYNTSASLQKTFRTNSTQTNSLSLYYSQASGESSGLGSVSNTSSAGISLSRNTNDVTIFLDISAFETRGTLGNALNARGVQGAATIGIPLTRTFSIQGGGQYQQYDQASPFGVSQKRVFVSLRYNNPNLVNFEK